MQNRHRIIAVSNRFHPYRLLISKEERVEEKGLVAIHLEFYQTVEVCD
tara:strand:- start:256 stop:399 length:144 start_codon:yes stop_codon:yes gene_type:complete